MQAYQRVLDQIEALGASLVAVSPELPDNSLTTAEKNELRFHVLSDPGNAVARQYGLVFRLDDELVEIYRNEFRNNLPEQNGDDSWELPVPGTFVIGTDSLIRLTHADPDYTHRLEPRELVDALG